MSVRHLLPIAGLLVVAIAGCNRETAPQGTTTVSKSTGGVGVVDLDLLAKQLGRDVQMNDEVQERLTSLNTKLTALKSSLNRLYDEKQSSFGGEPNEEQQKQLSAMQDRLAAQLLESKRKGENELLTFKQQLIDQFREQAKPVLREVAAARGLSIVVPKNNLLLLTVDPGVEITDEVAKKMLASQEKTTEPAAEKPRRRNSTETSAR